MTIDDEMRQHLIASAIQARQWAYAPYSHYLVGAALLTESGKVYDGINVENAVYPLGICAERVAIAKAVSEGERRFQAIAIATTNGGMPCGACRQVMAECSLEMRVLIADTEGHLLHEMSVADLLPGAFGPQDLPGQEA